MTVEELTANNAVRCGNCGAFMVGRLGHIPGLTVANHCGREWSRAWDRPPRGWWKERVGIND